MTNEEKRDFINLKIVFSSVPFTSELMRMNEFVSMIPNTLYKYRSFDDYAFEMIEKEYLYLTPSGQLDDPFDCLINNGLNESIDEDNPLSDSVLQYAVDVLIRHQKNGNLNRGIYISIVKNSLIEGEINKELFEKEINKYSVLSVDERNMLRNVFYNFEKVYSLYLNDGSFKNFLKYLIESKERIGVCALTTKRNNRPMWSLYADKYKGYCIEIEVSKEKTSVASLYPVIYEEFSETNLIQAIIKEITEILLRMASNGRINTQVGNLDQLLCIKNSDWESQDEWRYIGDAKSKMKNIKIKSIYLGYDVSKANESKMIELCNRKNIDLYKMKNPMNTYTIEFDKIN